MTYPSENIEPAVVHVDDMPYLSGEMLVQIQLPEGTTITKVPEEQFYDELNRYYQYQAQGDPGGSFGDWLIRELDW